MMMKPDDDELEKHVAMRLLLEKKILTKEEVLEMLKADLRDKFIYYMRLKYSLNHTRPVTMKEYIELQQEIRKAGITREIEEQLMETFQHWRSR